MLPKNNKLKRRNIRKDCQYHYMFKVVFPMWMTFYIKKLTSVVLNKTLLSTPMYINSMENFTYSL